MKLYKHILCALITLHITGYGQSSLHSQALLPQRAVAIPPLLPHELVTEQPEYRIEPFQASSTVHPLLPPSPVLLTATQPTPDTSQAAGEIFQEAAAIAPSPKPNPARRTIAPWAIRRIEDFTPLELAATNILEQLVPEPSTNSAPPQPAEQIECQFPGCSQTFALRSSLTNHLREHVGNNSYQCPICQKISAGRSQLRRHLRIHGGDKPYTCPTCNKSFAHNSTLTDHLRIHSGDKPYTCPTCNKSFARNSTLNNHMHMHTGAKPYTCPTCNKSFTRRSTLNNHMRMHTGAKPYTCPTCNKSFARKDNLNRHMHTH